MPAGFGIGPGHIEAAERVDAYQGAGAFPVQIQVADMEVAPGLLQVRAIVRDHRAGQPVVGIVGELDRFIEGGCLREGHDRTKDFLLGNTSGAGDVREDRRLYEIPLRIAGKTAEDQPAFAFPDFDIVENFTVRLIVDDGSYLSLGIEGLPITSFLERSITFCSTIS